MLGIQFLVKNSRHLAVCFLLFANTAAFAAENEIFDTHTRYSENDQYDQSRTALHQDIVTNAVAQSQPSSKPTLIVIFGGPGSGKSTTVERLSQAGLIEKNNFVTANSDLVKEQIPEYADFKNIDPKQAAENVHRESVEIRTKILFAAAAASKNIILEMAAIESTPPERLLQLKEQLLPNHTLILINVEAESETMIQRTKDRAKESGRWVSEEKVRAGRENSRNMFNALRPSSTISIDIDSQLSPPLIKSLSIEGQQSVCAIPLPNSSGTDYTGSKNQNSASNLYDFVGRQLQLIHAVQCGVFRSFLLR